MSIQTIKKVLNEAKIAAQNDCELLGIVMDVSVTYNIQLRFEKETDGNKGFTDIEEN